MQHIDGMSFNNAPCPAGDEVVSVVDVGDQVIQNLKRATLRQQGGIYRVTYIFVFNQEKQLLVQRRTKTKDQYPGLLDLAAGGVVGVGESYAQSARRELKEELGIEVPLLSHGKVYFSDISCAPVNQNWGMVFSCEYEGPFILQESEVHSVFFMDVSSILEMENSLITPDTRQVLVSHLL